MSGPVPPELAGLGGTIGPRLADLLSRATVITRAKMAPHQRAVALGVLGDFTDLMSDEARSAIGPLLSALASDPAVGPEARALVDFLAHRRGQWQMFAAATTTGAVMGGGLVNLLTNELNPAILRLIGSNPNGVITPSDAALASARRIAGPPDWRSEAAAGGINASRFNALVELNRSLPTLGEVLDLLNRRLITMERAVRLLQRAGYRDQDIPSLVESRRRHLSPEQLAVMHTRGIVTTATGRELASEMGMRADDFDRMVEADGEPLSIGDLLTAQRRGIIDADRVRRGWVQSPVRNEWFDVAQSLQYSPMSTVDAADAVNQGHMGADQGRTIAQQNGMIGEHFEILLRTAGLPPGVELATEAWNRGLITEEEFTTAFLESRLKNRYVPLYKALRWRVIPQETVRRLYRAGVYTREQAALRLAHNGFSPEDREALLAAEDGQPTDSTVELTKAEVLTLFSDHAIDESTARDMLKATGVGDGETAWLLMIAEIRRARRYSDAVVARVRAGYVAHRLDVGQASSIMDALRIPVDQREQLIDLWDLERMATTKGLTTAQIQAALRRGLIDRDGARRRYVEQGYSDDDAAILVTLATPAARG